jgi:hypothetical protein
MQVGRGGLELVSGRLAKFLRSPGLAASSPSEGGQQLEVADNRGLFRRIADRLQIVDLASVGAFLS